MRSVFATLWVNLFVPSFVVECWILSMLHRSSCRARAQKFQDRLAICYLFPENLQSKRIPGRTRGEVSEGKALRQHKAPTKGLLGVGRAEIVCAQYRLQSPFSIFHVLHLFCLDCFFALGPSRLYRLVYLLVLSIWHPSPPPFLFFLLRTFSYSSPDFFLCFSFILLDSLFSFCSTLLYYTTLSPSFLLPFACLFLHFSPLFSTPRPA